MTPISTIRAEVAQHVASYLAMGGQIKVLPSYTDKNPPIKLPVRLANGGHTGKE